MMRKRLMKMWREAKALHSDPVEAWASIIEDADKAKVLLVQGCSRPNL